MLGTKKTILEMNGITKTFDGKPANDNVTLKVNEGEIVALLGENGAGKSTLMNILFGLYKPDSGEIRIDGEVVTINSPLDAIELGVGMVHQHFMLISAFTTYENIALSLSGKRNGVIDSQHIRQEIDEHSKKYNLSIAIDTITQDLPVGLQQQVEILKALLGDCRILVLDEPTGVLNEQEKEKLFASLKELKASGLSIIFISHKLDEVLEISDRVVILRRGKMVDAVDTKDTNKADLASRMVGRDVVFSVVREEDGSDKTKNEKVLEIRGIDVRGIRHAQTIKNLSLTIHKGELFGIAGVDGNGQSELVEAIAGLTRVIHGEILLNGNDITNMTPRFIKQSGLAFIPEDRRSTGIVSSYNLDQNIFFRRSDSDVFRKSFGRIDTQKLHHLGNQLIEEFDIRIANRNMPVGQLSGGNIQKVILAREISSDPYVLVAMHPTRGLDVGAIEFVHQRLLDLLSCGAGILLISTELDEIMSLSDRMAVMSNGTLSDPFKPNELTLSQIGMLMGGSERGDTAV